MVIEAIWRDRRDETGMAPRGVTPGGDAPRGRGEGHGPPRSDEHKAQEEARGRGRRARHHCGAAQSRHRSASPTRLRLAEEKAARRGGARGPVASRGGGTFARSRKSFATGAAENQREGRGCGTRTEGSQCDLRMHWLGRGRRMRRLARPRRARVAAEQQARAREARTPLWRRRSVPL